MYILMSEFGFLEDLGKWLDLYGIQIFSIKECLIYKS